MKHPAAQDALRYIKSRPDDVLRVWRDTFGLGEDELSGICWTTLTKIENGTHVCERDILGLAYVMKQGECG